MKAMKDMKDMKSMKGFWPETTFFKAVAETMTKAESLCWVSRTQLP
jgi:hypothetical protein